MPRIARYTREEALDNAVQLFWRRGYAGSSMKQIEQALDMRPGSLYAKFGSKDGLFLEALERYTELLVAEFESHCRSASSPLGVLTGYVQGTVDQLLDPERPARACMIVKTLLEVTDELPAVRQRVNELLAALEKRFEEILLEAREAGEIREDVDCGRLARLFQVQLMGLRSFAQRDVEPETIRALAEDITGLLDLYRAAH